MIRIMGRYKNNAVEELDTARDKKEADFLVGEYRLAFGKDWTIWEGDKEKETNESE